MIAGQITDTEGAVVHGYIRTFEGHQVFIHDPEQADQTGSVTIRDVAHALALQCRFNGHCRTFYSVAQHSVLASRMPEHPGDALWFLLHDAPEAYTGDLVGPLKPKVAMWKRLEGKWELVIRTRFDAWPGDQSRGACWRQEKRCKAVDLLLLGREMMDLLPCEDHKMLGYLDDRRPSDLPRIRPWSWRKARRKFLVRFHELTGSPLSWWEKLKLLVGVY